MKSIRLLPLCFLWVVVVPALLAAEPAADKPSFKNAGVDQFDSMRANPKSVILDVRTKKEFDAGHIPGAINVDWNGPDFGKQVAGLDKSKTYLVHCAGGTRSAKACAAMGKLQFTNCYNLEGGFKAWEKAGKPVQK